MSATPTMVTRGEELREAMRRVRGTWRRRVVLEGAVVAVAVVLVMLALVLAVVSIQGVRPGSIELARALVWLSLAGAAGWWMLRPALRRVDDARLALYLDEHDPALAQTVLSAVQESSRPIEQQLSPALTARLATSAVGALERLDHGAAVEQPRTVVAGKRLAGLLGAAAVALLLLPSPWQATARAVLMPWDAAAAVPVRSIAVLPGDVTLPRGASLDLEADLSGFTTRDAELVLLAEDGAELLRLPMEPDTLGMHFGVRLFDISRDMTYRVESGGVRSERHLITVTDLPAVRELALELDYPGYTGLASEVISPGGDVAAVVGTDVTVTATITMPVREGVMRFDDGTMVPMPLDSAGQPMGRFRVATTGFYTVDLVTSDGTTVPGTVRNLVDALPDRAPTVRITAPGRDTKPTSVEEVAVEVRADDDYGVRTLELVYTVNGGAEQRILLVTNGRPGLVEPRAVHMLFLEALPLVPGDLVAYHALATDGGGNTARSDLYFLEIRPFSRNYRQAESGGAGGAGEAGDDGEVQSPEGLSARQRELVVATFNALRDSATTAPARAREDQTTIALAQGKLRSDVTALGAQVTSRRVAELDSTFVLIRTALDSAAAAMGAAEEALGRGGVRAAMPAQQRALQQLQRAEAAYREVEVQMGAGEPGGGGGGGGGGGAPEELADLFELQTDRLQNQYEAVQQQASAGQAGAREVDEAQERLRDLARRAQAENERARRLAEALQQRLSEQGGGGATGGAGAPGGAAGGGGAQRQLAAEAEAEARRLERLAREQRTPALEEAARQARQAADQLRRAAAGDPARGGEAVEALRRAGQSVEQGREAAARDAIEGLAGQAQRMGERQREIGADAIALPPSGNAARGAALAELDRRKVELARDVQALDDAMASAEAAARREASGASEGLTGARETIREGELPVRIEYSRRVARSGSPEYVQNFEDQIGAYLEQVEQQLREAAGAVGTSSARRQERALEQARELTRAAQAMRERGEQGQGQRGEGGEQGQALGRGQEGEGEQQGQGQAGQGANQGQGEQQGQAGQRGEMPGQGMRPDGGGDARQLSGEARSRRQAAESLRGELAQLGVSLPELNEAIDALRRMEGERALADPRNLAALREAVAASLQRVEFELWRRFGTPAGSRPAAGVAGDAPAAYRALVEEYFRTIARDRR